jgi:hypothetical protein
MNVTCSLGRTGFLLKLIVGVLGGLLTPCAVPTCNINRKIIPKNVDTFFIF